jgi:hypothetical protein
MEHVLKTTTNKFSIQPLAFGDIEASTGSKVELP